VDYCQGLQHHRGSYVAQDDAAYASLTVRETLTLSALLRLPREMSRTEKIARVRAPNVQNISPPMLTLLTSTQAESVIAELGLQDAADTRVGGDRNRGLSGGERRRLSIGEVLIPDPSAN
jgi:ABC-type multidrug transport system ATPase subunit